MNIREAALTMLEDYERDGKYINLALTSHKYDRLTPAERASLTALVYTTVENKLTYDYYISSLAKRQTDKLDPYTLNLLRIGTAQIVSMEAIPDFAAVNETVKLARNKGESSFVNAVLRAIAKAKKENALPLPKREKSVARYISVAYSFPLWLTRHFISMFGEDATEEIFREFNSEGHTDLSVNLTKISREDYAGRLAECGIRSTPSTLNPLTLRLVGSYDPRRLPGFSEGLFYVQDTASATSAYLLRAEGGDRVLDVCACPGGKSFATAILTSDSAIESYDLHESKLSLISSSAERLGITNIKSGVRDATEYDEELARSFDKIICDAPCSGLGVLGKKPDMRYRTESSLTELPKLQRRILEVSSRYLKEGGRMIYSTCTLNRAENEDIVLDFLNTHSDFSLESFEVGGYSAKDGMLTFVPNIHKTDGFFVAVLRKSS